MPNVAPELIARYLAAQQESLKRQAELEAIVADPKWWVGKDVPPLEPYQRFLEWVDLELQWLRS